MTKKQYAPGEIIIAEGTCGTQTYLIHDGLVLICKETGGTAGRIKIAKLGQGEVFGEMYLFDETGFRSASVIAQTNVTVEVISQEEMKQILLETPPIVHSILRTLSSRLAQTSQENTFLKLSNTKNWLSRICDLLAGH